jgi:FtsP/CotA-like multicopper oxidase with cupredoxin domain
VDPDEEQTTQLHNGATGTAPKITHVSDFTYFDSDDAYYEGAFKDMVVVLPGDPDAFTGKGAVIRTIPFPKVGHYSFHCHILSHEVRIIVSKHIIMLFLTLFVLGFVLLLLSGP